MEYSVQQQQQQPQFGLIGNTLQFRTVETGQVDGVKLNHDEKEYLLPHFLMLLVGKPGSGKTTLLKQLLTNNQMYHRKFDDVFIVSPSHAKMGIKVKPENSTARFSLDWLFEKFDKINEEQQETVFGNRAGRTAKDTKQTPQGKRLIAEGLVLSDPKTRFNLSEAFTSSALGAAQVPGKVQQKAINQEESKKEVAKQVAVQKQYEHLKKLPREEQERTHRNVLVVLDDVVGQIKKAEFDPRLAQLVMNRRHLIFNGTISLIMVTQKYTLIPSRVRSNANWLILYQLNPMDFETAYRDSVTLTPRKWRDLLHFVYGIDLNPERANQKQDKEQVVYDQYSDTQERQPARVEDIVKGKKYENMGIWVESNMYFKNFKRIDV